MDARKLEGLFTDILGRVRGWEQEIRKDERAKILAMLGGKVPANGAGKGKVARKASAPRKLPKVCPVPGCENKASASPRHSFCCDTHKKASPEKRKGWLASWKAKQLPAKS